MTKRILVIDDSISIRRVIHDSLNKQGYEILLCESALNASEFLNGQNIDLIITDLHMPGMNGIDLIKSIRSNEIYQYTPVLVLTTENQEQKKKEAKIAGATGWVMKPFNTQKLLYAIHKVIK